MLYRNDKVRTAGLTGMSGAGKTTACEVFTRFGFAVIDCDLVSREVVEKGAPALNEISGYFGADILTQEGNLDRRRLGGIVFSDREKLKQLNDLIYPYITFNIIEKITKLSASGKQLVLLDAPTLFESGANELCDAVVSLTADKELCLARIMKRDGIAREQAEKRLSSQYDAGFYAERSDVCVENNGTQAELERRLSEAAEKVKKLFAAGETGI